VLSDRQVRFGYGERVVEVEPLGLVLKGRSWYLVARSGERLFTYAVRRLRRPELLDEPVARPDDFDLAATWGRLVAEFEAGLPSVEIRLRASTAAIARLRRVVDSRSRQLTDWHGEPAESGWRCLTVSFERLEYALPALVGLGAEVEVLEPLELRRAIVTEADSLAQLYARAGGVLVSTQSGP
jgi:predicted DNA-binding transcriptional regulator YafY